LSVRIGILYPGHAAEHDYELVTERLGGRCTFEVVHTSIGEDAHRIDALLDMGRPERLREGARRLRAPVAAVMWACTSGSFVYGLDGARRQAQDLASALGVPASSTSLAFVSALRALGAQRAAIAATYPAAVTERFRDFLKAAGVEPLLVASQGIVTAAEVGALGRESALELAAAADHPDAEAVLVPDTALHSIGLLEELEDRARKPVLTANQVSAWEALRLSGLSIAGPGLGRLFEEGGDRAAPPR
jgi:maleate cis-trans isomerase